MQLQALRRRSLGRAALRERRFLGTALPLSFAVDLKTGIVPRKARGSGTPTFTRSDTTAPFQTDFEGKLNAVLSGEVRFQGARRVYNLLTFTEDLSNAVWTKQTQGSGSAPTRVSGNTYRYITGGTASADRSYFRYTTTGLSSTGTYVLRCKISASQSVVVRFIDQANNAAEVLFQATTTPTVVQKKWVADLASPRVEFGLFGNVSGNVDVNITVTEIQLENVTGQTNQNPSEYVSVGVLSAPYHGAGVDGVRYFNTLNGNTVASNVVTEATGAPINSSTAKFGVLPGAVASYFSAGSIALRSSTQIEIIGKVAPNSWTTGGYTIWGAYQNADPLRCAVFIIATTGTLDFRHSPDGTTGAQITDTSTSAVSFAAGTTGYVKLTYQSDSGGGSYATKFWTSTDNGATWTQLGTTKTGSASVLYTGSTPVNTVGVRGPGSSEAFNGNIYRVTVASTIGGVPYQDFNPNDSTSAQTWTSATTGEVWTTNSNARVFGNTNATYGIPAPWDSGGPLGYLAEGARSNRCLHSQSFRIDNQLTVSSPSGTFTDGETVGDGTLTGVYRSSESSATKFALSGCSGTTWAGTLTGVTSGKTATIDSTVTVWQPTTMTIAHHSVAAPDGTTTADTLTAAGANSTLIQDMGTVASAAKTGALWIKRKTGTGNIDLTMDGGATWTTQTVTANWTRFTKTQTLADEDFGIRIVTDTDAVYVWQGDVETASFASSDIPTVTVAVTRPADVLTYASAGNISGTQGTAYAEVTTLWTNANGPVRAGIFEGSGGGAPLLWNNGVNLLKVYDGSTELAGQAFSGSPVVQKVASSWAGSSVQTATGGASTTTNGFDGDLGMGANIQIGGTTLDPAQYWNGTIRNVRIYSSALPASTLQAMTT